MPGSRNQTAIGLLAACPNPTSNKYTENEPTVILLSSNTVSYMQCTLLTDVSGALPEHRPANLFDELSSGTTQVCTGCPAAHLGPV